jgi:hypothetical protein
MKEVMERHEETLKEDVKSRFRGKLVNRESFI